METCVSAEDMAPSGRKDLDKPDPSGISGHCLAVNNDPILSRSFILFQLVSFLGLTKYTLHNRTFSDLIYDCETVLKVK